MSSIFVFDAYGTLFDVHAAIARFRGEAGPDADRLSEIWRSMQLEYTWTLTLADLNGAGDFRVTAIPQGLARPSAAAYMRCTRQYS